MPFNISSSIKNIYALILIFCLIRFAVFNWFLDASVLQSTQYLLTHRQLFIALVLAPIVETLIQMLFDNLFRRKKIKPKNAMLFVSGAAFAGLHLSASNTEIISVMSSIATYFCMGLLLQLLYTKAKDVSANPYLLTVLGHLAINSFVVLSILVKSGF